MCALLGLFGALLLLPAAAWSQTSAPNALGVSAGHQHLAGLDAEAHTAFWTALGAEPAQLGANLQILKLPGVFLMFQNAGGRGRGGAAPAAAPAPSEGSTVEHLTFKVKSLKDALSKLDAIGIKPLSGAGATQAFVMAPNSVKVQLVEDANLPTTIASHEMLMKVPNAAEAVAWYEQWFGARIARQGGAIVGEIPGMNIRFAETKEPVAGTQGRAIAHIGFEVQNLEAFMKKLEAGGVNVTRPYAAAPATIAPLKSLAFVTDPWGTSIELNEGFADIP